eukprot:2625677-Amphidinium_carterae.3
MNVFAFFMRDAYVLAVFEVGQRLMSLQSLKGGGLCPCKLLRQSEAYVLAIFEGSQRLMSLQSLKGSEAYVLAVFEGVRGLCPCNL